MIACVGETEAEREAGETEAVLRRQVARRSRHDDNLVIAYEPVWAIGTGKTATPEMAQEAHELIKSLLDVPVLYGGSVKPDNAAELLAQPDVDGALVGGASLDVDSFAAICRRRVPLVALVILDGWGCAPPGPGQRRRARRHAGVRPALARRYPHTTLEASGEAVGLPPGQMGNSEVGHLTIGSGRRLYQDLMRVNKAIEDGSFFENPALRAAFERGAARAPARPRLARRRPLAHRPPAGAAALRAGEDLDPRVHRRPRRLAARGGRTTSPSCRWTGSRRSSAATTRWTATSAGSARSAPSTRSSTATATHARRSVAARASELRRRRHRRVHRADRASTGTPRLEPGDTAIFFNFRPDRGAAAHAAAARRTAST